MGPPGLHRFCDRAARSRYVLAWARRAPVEWTPPELLVNEQGMPMRPEGSITTWIEQLKAGDRAAAQPIWERFFARLVGLARKKLQGLPRRAAANEEDI